MPNVIVHGSGSPAAMTETIAQASNGMPRPQSITITTSSATPPNSFTTGTYSYDGAGNIKTIGSDHFRYDRFQRLAQSQLGSVEPGREQRMEFDVYGNITKTTTDDIDYFTDTSPSTNRLIYASYDPLGSGNTTAWNTNTYAWDPLNRMTHWSNASEGWSYVYTADDERLWSIKDVANAAYSNWTFRGFGNELLVRDERRPGTTTVPEWSCPGGGELVDLFCDGFENGTTSEWSSSTTGPHRTLTLYAYREGRLAASLGLGGDYVDYVTDHLGTIRVATNLFGEIGAQHTYFPFGQEATSTWQDDVVLKFTGHERDLQSTITAPGDDFDYLHARYRSPVTGRFFSVDPVGGNPKAPQSWNRYAYVRGSPLRRIDLGGQADRDTNKELARVHESNAANGIQTTPCERCRNLILGLSTPVVVAAAGGVVASLPIVNAAGLANAGVFGATVNGINSAVTHPDRAGEALAVGSAVGFVEGAIPLRGIGTVGKITAASLATSRALGDDITLRSAAFAAAGAVARSRLAFAQSLPGVGPAEDAVLEAADRTLEVMFSAASAAVDLLDGE